jgi:hypothetical protein
MKFFTNIRFLSMGTTKPIGRAEISALASASTKIIYAKQAKYQSMADTKFTAEQIAPCGMNCGICKAYLAYSHGVPTKKGQVTHCLGCLVRNKNCAFIKRNCEKIRKQQIRFCYECADMPCKRLAHLDEHYRERYSMSMIENQKIIHDKGMDEFLKSQAEKYRCSNCDDVVSVHNGKCYACGYQGEKPIRKVGKARWDRARWVPDGK